MKYALALPTIQLKLCLHTLIMFVYPVEFSGYTSEYQSLWKKRDEPVLGLAFWAFWQLRPKEGMVSRLSC